MHAKSESFEGYVRIIGRVKKVNRFTLEGIHTLGVSSDNTQTSLTVNLCYLISVFLNGNSVSQV